jgi:hypothetical protein
MLSRNLVIIQDAMPESGELLLTVISRIGQLGGRLKFHIKTRPIGCLWIDVTMQLFDCETDQTKLIDVPFTLRSCSH